MKSKFFALAVAGMLSTGSAFATTYSFGGSGPQDANGGTVDTVGDVLDTIATDGDNSVRYDDYINDAMDSYWAVSGSGGSSSTMIIELAGYAGTNSFGIYDKSAPHDRVTLFNGASTAGSQAHLSIKADGSVFVNFGDSGVDFASNNFGFFLDSSAGADGGLWYSDSSMNSDGVDHMAAYQGDDAETIAIGGNSAGTWTDNEYALAFEDMDCNKGCDGDYTDFMVMVESVEPVPAPASLALLGLGLGLLGYSARRSSKKRA